jgi:hypothetical protein
MIAFNTNPKIIDKTDVVGSLDIEWHPEVIHACRRRQYDIWWFTEPNPDSGIYYFGCGHFLLLSNCKIGLVTNRRAIREERRQCSKKRRGISTIYSLDENNEEITGVLSFESMDSSTRKRENAARCFSKQLYSLTNAVQYHKWSIIHVVSM